MIASGGDDNTVGERRAGSDGGASEPGPDARDDAPLNGAVTVSVGVEDEATAARVSATFGEFDAAYPGVPRI